MLVTFLNTCWNNDKVLIWKTTKTTQSHSSQPLGFQAIFMERIEQALWRACNCSSFMMGSHRGSPMGWKRELSVLKAPLSSSPFGASKGVSVGGGTPTWGTWDTYYYCFHFFLVLLVADVAFSRTHAATGEQRPKARAKACRPVSDPPW